MQRALSGRLRDSLSDEERGQLLESYVFHELLAHAADASVGGEFSYWRTVAGNEVDFIWQRGAKRVAIEVKATRRWRSEYDRGLLALADAKLSPTRRFGVYLGTEALARDFGKVLPLPMFLEQLADGSILG